MATAPFFWLALVGSGWLGLAWSGVGGHDQTEFFTRSDQNGTLFGILMNLSLPFPIEKFHY